MLDSPAPRRTRKSSLSESIDLTASPLRRTTRAMSSDREITASPLPTRATRRSMGNVAESDEESIIETTTPGRSKVARKNARKSTMISPTIDLIEEEPEEENQKMETSKNESEMSANELELRNRSISKSPNVSISPQKTRELSVVLDKVKDKSTLNFSALDDDDEEETEKPGKIFKHRNQFSKDKTSDDAEISFDDGDNSEIEKFSSNAKSQSAKKTTLENVMDNVKMLGDILLSPTRMFRGRKSIHGESSSNSENELAKMMEDFVPDDDVVMNSPKSGPKTPKSVQKTPKNVEGTPVTTAKTPKSSEKATSITETPKKTPESAEKIPATPKSAVKTLVEAPKSAAKSPKGAEKIPTILQTPKSAAKTPKSSEKTPVPVTVETPKSAAKTPKSAGTITELIENIQKTPKSSEKTPKSSDKTPAQTPKSVEIPKSAAKTQTTPKSAPKSASKTPAKDSPKALNGNGLHHEITIGADEMDITSKDASMSDMEISMSSPSKNGSAKLSPVKTDMKTVSIEKIQLNTSVVQESTEQSPKMNKSLSKYIETVQTSSERRKSIAAPKSPLTPLSRSWTHSIRKSADGVIDTISHEAEPEVVKASPRKHKPISSDESDDDHEQNPFVDDEAEVGSEEESITESMRNYLEENEIPEEGESIGSQDSNELDDEEDEEDNESFIDDGEVSVTYDLDSEEEKIENAPKRRSRIIKPSSSSEDEEKEEDVKALEKSLVKTITVSAEVEEDSEEIEEEAPEVEEEAPEVEESAVIEPVKTKKRKRNSDMNESVVGKKKRAKLNESANESEAKHMEDLSVEAEPAEPKLRKLKKVMDPTKSADIHSVLTKCNAFMGAYEEGKKANMARKREKKALKMAKKQQALKEAAAENLDSSNGENKENAPKKKKKKAKKQKPVEGEFENVFVAKT
jgi:hypothetical protein